MGAMKSIVTGKPQLNRQINAALVFELVRRQGALSRAALADLTGLRPPSVSAIVEQLIREKRLRETGRGPSTGGRAPVLLQVNPDGASVIGAVLSETEALATLADLTGRELATVSADLRSSTPDAALAALAGLVQKLTRRARSASRVGGLGIAVPGLISQPEGRVTLSVPLQWRDVPLREQAEKLTGLRTFLVNNAMAATITEQFEGEAKGSQSLLFFMVHLADIRDARYVNLGSAIILDGRPFFGERHAAGEISGKVAHPLAAGGGTLDALVRRGLKGEAKAGRAWAQLAENLGELVAHGISFLSPGRVVIGSDVPELEDLIGRPLRERIRREAIPGDPGETPVSFSRRGPAAIARGAVIVALEALSRTHTVTAGIL